MAYWRRASSRVRILKGALICVEQRVALFLLIRAQRVTVWLSCVSRDGCELVSMKTYRAMRDFGQIIAISLSLRPVIDHIGRLGAVVLWWPILDEFWWAALGLLVIWMGAFTSEERVLWIRWK
jgi:hypothetical protein